MQGRPCLPRPSPTPVPSSLWGSLATPQLIQERLGLLPARPSPPAPLFSRRGAVSRSQRHRGRIRSGRPGGVGEDRVRGARTCAIRARAPKPHVIADARTRMWTIRAVLRAAPWCVVTKRRPMGRTDAPTKTRCDRALGHDDPAEKLATCPAPVYLPPHLFCPQLRSHWLLR